MSYQHRDQPDGPDSDPSTTARLARAVVYLRVSTQSQVNTDYDPEGISLPAQRQSCERKAAQMGNVIIVDEYVEPGKSGTSMDKRPAYRAMLERIRTERDIDYVIIYKLSRLNRNRLDDALTITELRKYKVSLVSATESIDESPVGQLMHGILASFNEFRSAEDGADIRYKMGEKAKRGGTLGRAPLGYSNIRERYEGREVRTVALDPERAPFVKLAFELYATGRFTLEALVDELTDRGLQTRPGRYPAGPVSDAKLSTMLRDRYYLGYVTYDGEEFPGRHEALVEPELFARVQTILDSKRTARERDRVHQHYLKGSLWCGTCHRRGQEHRMILNRAVGKGGVYFYFFCRGRQVGLCDSPYVAIETVEDAVAAHVATMQFTPEFIASVRGSVSETVADQHHASNLHRNQIKIELSRLDVQEENLLDLAAQGSAKQKIRQRLNDIEVKRSRLTAELQHVDADLNVGMEIIQAALQLMGDPGTLYRRVNDQDRRLMLQSIFTRLYIDHDSVTHDELREPFAELVSNHRHARPATRHIPADHAPKTAESRPKACSRDPFSNTTDLLTAALAGNGWSKAAMVELRGIEPLTSSMPWKRSAN